MLPEEEKNLIPVAEKLSKDLYSGAEFLQVLRGQPLEVRSEIGDATLASLLQDRFSFLGGTDVHEACVIGISGDLNQFIPGESRHHAAHRGWFYLLGCGQFAERLRTAKNQHGKRR